MKATVSKRTNTFNKNIFKVSILLFLFIGFSAQTGIMVKARYENYEKDYQPVINYIESNIDEESVCYISTAPKFAAYTGRPEKFVLSSEYLPQRNIIPTDNISKQLTEKVDYIIMTEEEWSDESKPVVKAIKSSDEFKFLTEIESREKKSRFNKQKINWKIFKVLG